MRLSGLQKFVLLKCYNCKQKKIDRQIFLKYYKKSTVSSVKTITQSLESLIDKELLIGFGKRTPHKWFITQVSLTKQGNNMAKKLLGQQLQLKLKNKKK